ncbi:heme-binding protein [Streptomyces virginiae]|uniref:GlcG/HbpS family heme-binding protein n=1 Tax=Streptomyces virginiae TaxID=1961 RepID=UPI00381402A0
MYTATAARTAVAPLTTEDAELLVTAATSAAEAAGATVSVTVLDAGGHLLAFRRDDRAVLISGETSTRKAYTALQLDAPTADLVDAVRPDGPFHTLPTALGGVWPIMPGSRRVAPRLAALSSLDDAPRRLPRPPCDPRHHPPLPDPA